MRNQGWKVIQKLKLASNKQSTQIKKFQLKKKQFDIGDSSDEDLQYHDELNVNEEKLEAVSDKQIEERLHKFQVAINWPFPFGPGDDIKGSGILISKDLVLTCAHNFYYKNNLADKNKVKIYVAPCGELINPLTVQDIYIPQGYKAVQKASYDYALVKLKEQTNLEGFIPLTCNVLQKIQTELIAIYGYPQISYTRIKYQKNQQVVQYGLMRKDRIPEDLKKNKILYHRISTENGHSGSPLILIEKTKNQKEPELHIVAIHKGGVTLKKKDINQQQKKNIFNFSRLLTRQVIDELNKQAKKMKAQPFMCSVEAQALNEFVLQTSYLNQYQSPSLHPNIYKRFKQVSPQHMNLPLHQNIALISYLNQYTHMTITGSGCFIQKNLVLTTAHLFYNVYNGYRLEDEMFRIYVKGKKSVKSYEIENVYVPEKYQSSNSQPLYDYALVKIKQNIQNKSFIPLGFVSKNEKLQTLAIFGWNNNRSLNEQNIRSLNEQNIIEGAYQQGYVQSNPSLEILKEKGAILYDIPKSQGSGKGGSPVIQVLNGGMKLIGIHKGAMARIVQGQRIQKKIGRMITQDMLMDLKNQALRMGGEMFRIHEQQ